ncbi:MAG: hypothetical protein P8Y47_08375 [Alphaproteobacteria bacterium]
MKAKALATNSDFVDFFTIAHQQIISDIEAFELDGSKEAEQKVLELVRDLHALMRIKRTIFGPIARQRAAPKADA